MGKIETITPVHIFNGQNFWFIKKENYIYALDKLIESVSLSSQSLRKLVEINNPGQKDFINILNFNLNSLEPKDAISMKESYGKYAFHRGNVFQNTKYFDLPYIPASSLKGAFINVFWFNFINHNDDVKEYLIKQKDLLKELKSIDNEIKSLRKYFIVNDVIFEQEAIIYNVKRYNTTKVLGFNENVETIDKELIQFSDIVKDLNSKERNLLNKLKNNLLNQNREKTILQKAIEELYNYIINFKIIFPKANKEYMKKVLIKEQSFIYNARNDKIKSNYLKNFYKFLISELENDKIIMQIGRYTNYVDKSFSIAFGEFYEKNFKTIFTPIKTKKVSTIETMNLITIDDQGIYPLGFVKLEF